MATRYITYSAQTIANVESKLTKDIRIKLGEIDMNGKPTSKGRRK
jgi:hypothetical protein